MTVKICDICGKMEGNSTILSQKEEQLRDQLYDIVYKNIWLASDRKLYEMLEEEEKDDRSQ